MQKIRKPIRLIELFAGIGTQALALRDLGVQFEYWKTVEFDKYAVKSYNIIHSQNIVPTDIKDIDGKWLDIKDTDKYEYILSYSFPCTDISIAGKQEGMARGSGTRSGLLWEVERLINEVDELPQILLLENVPQIHNSKNMPHFQEWIDFLSSKGYKSYWSDMNAKDFCVAQNRNRTFMISILGSDEPYVFPETKPLNTVIEDYLEKEVDEKYFVNNEKSNALIEKLIKENSVEEERRSDIIYRGNIYGEHIHDGFGGAVFDKQGLCPAIKTCQGGNRQPLIVVKNKNYSEIRLGNIYGFTGGNYAGIVYSPEGLCPSINTCGGGNRQPMIFKEYRIRKLTPKECFRLQGIKDEDFIKAESVNSNSQLYKQAGNGECEEVVKALFKQMF